MEQISEHLLYGRQLVVNRKYPEYELPTWVEKEAAILNGKCRRCGQHPPYWARLPQGTYCWSCHMLGRLTSNDDLVMLAERNQFAVPNQFFKWTGHLTTKQANVAQELKAGIQRGQLHLIHAVTGAGKTEMLYPTLVWAISQQYRIGIVAPRIDVVEELGWRIKRDFLVKQMVLHGQTTLPYDYTQIVIATVQQLLRFYRAFDLLIVDEFDAYPLVDNPVLLYAIKRAVKIRGSLIYLTATLPKRIAPTIKVLKLNKRFHGGPLPLLDVHFCWDWRRYLPRHLQKNIQALRPQQQVLVFVPKVSDLEPLAEKLRIYSQKVDIIHAQSKRRKEVIDAFKRGEIQVLVTTSLLERGVTFPKIDVAIMGAEEALYTKAMLIQIAGRCGRSIERKEGHVWTYIRTNTWKIQQVNQELRALNEE
ncbi:helicase-related protein [Pediococcus pentosaceus]|uniref:helicase-related protein n=1 Tax=Pediococcus pentosaceus TaxID=1255 RepID=UPI0039822BD7